MAGKLLILILIQSYILSFEIDRLRDSRIMNLPLLLNLVSQQQFGMLISMSLVSAGIEQ